EAGHAVRRRRVREAYGRPRYLGRWTLRNRRQRKGKSRAFVELALRPDAPAMSTDDALDDGQAHAGAGKVLAPVQSLEYAEKLFRVAHVEARAVVDDLEDRLAILETAEDLHLGRGPLGAVLERVADEVRPNLAHHGRVAHHRWQFPDLQQ